MRSPFDEALAVWHLADLSDAARAGSGLKAVGDVRVGVPLEGPAREASLARGGDGFAAQFEGGYLDAGQGADGAPDLRGAALTVAARFRLAPGARSGFLLAKHGGPDCLVYSLFVADLGSGPVLGFEVGTQVSRGATQVSVPLGLLGASAWHDVVCRYDGAKLQLFVDGVWLDEEFPMGRVRQGNREPRLIGAASVGGATRTGFRGLLDHVALWDRALTDGEIEVLSGGPEVVASSRARMLGAPGPMQYFRPHNQFFVGDTLPFFRDGVFRFYYLLDRGHHSAKGYYGAHQWAQASSTDLVQWEHHPLAVPITEALEGSICTGSVFYHDGTYHAYYATRIVGRGEHLSLATSRDGVHFEKTLPNPFLSPGPQHTQDFRDPHVFRDERTGLLHLLVSSRFRDDGRGCLAHYTSRDLEAWEEADPFLIVDRSDVPECPDTFEWNGWYYLVLSLGGVAYYRMSREPLGPWSAPQVDSFDGPAARVMKTAAFTGNRRLGTAFLAVAGYAGYAVFRELVQHEDGTLGTKLPPEMALAAGEPLPQWGGEVRVKPGEPPVTLAGLPHSARLTMLVTAGPGCGTFGLRLRGSDAHPSGHELWFAPERQEVGVTGAAGLEHVTGLDQPFRLEIILKDDILDVCLDDRRTLVNRVEDLAGDRLEFYADGGEVTFSGIDIRPLTA